MQTPIKRSILINATPAEVWDYLTIPAFMKTWIGDPEMQIEIISEWKVGSPFAIRGFHHAQFENRGKIIRLEPEAVFQYEYLSSLSNLEDAPGNYTTIAFYLQPKEEQTELIVEAINFPTIEIYKHVEFYWNGTLGIIKEKIESERIANTSAQSQIL